MDNNNIKENKPKSGLNLLGTLFTSLKNPQNSNKKPIYKSILTSRNISRNKNINITTLNSTIFSNNTNDKIINDKPKKTEILKSESNNSEVKLMKSYTKSTDNKFKSNNNIFKDTNIMKILDKKNTFKLINKNSLNGNLKGPSKIFKTTLNENRNSDKKIFLYKDGDIKTIKNDLEIPEEDKIFEETKKYDYFTERYKRIYKIIDNNDFENKEIKNTKSVKFLSDMKPTKEQIPSSIKYFDSKGNYIPSNLDKELFDCLYKTTDELNFHINSIKKSKQKKKLKEYQNDLLDSIKNVISIYGYDKLRNKLEEIHKYNRYKKRLNYKYIKQLENNEKKIIQDVNKCNKYYLRSKKSKGFIKYKFELPPLEFKSVIKNRMKDKKFMDIILSRNTTVMSSSKSVRNAKKNKVNIKELKLNLLEK